MQCECNGDDDDSEMQSPRKRLHSSLNFIHDDVILSHARILNEYDVMPENRALVLWSNTTCKHDGHDIVILPLEDCPQSFIILVCQITVW